ncbi:molybdopterin-dependent oxidoreductase (plasmid) [Sinorhizobium chiapasense]|uniref:molybdopterin-dependent oxidoreductase n=1 Tax=Sinorhizobium chiapasense TaxID=501572 RepID=UPI002FE42ADC
MRVLLAVIALAFSLVSGQGVAEDNVILTINGKITGGTPVNFSRADLEAIGSATIATTTPWHDGVITFEGVPLSKLMEKVGASGKIAFVVALNDYATEIPLSDFSDYDVILAIKQNGNYMEVADKGPLFVIYPYDDKPELKSETYFSRSAWQVRTITIE